MDGLLDSVTVIITMTKDKEQIASRLMRDGKIVQTRSVGTQVLCTIKEIPLKSSEKIRELLNAHMDAVKWTEGDLTILTVVESILVGTTIEKTVMKEVWTERTLSYIKEDNPDPESILEAHLKHLKNIPDLRSNIYRNS